MRGPWRWRGRKVRRTNLLRLQGCRNLVALDDGGRPLLSKSAILTLLSTGKQAGQDASLRPRLTYRNTCPLLNIG